MQQSMEGYASGLAAMSVTDLTLLSKLEASDLVSLGITKGKEKRRVLACISKLKEQLPGQTTSQTSETAAADPSRKHSDLQEPPRTKSRKHVVLATPSEPSTSSIAAGESTESEANDMKPSRASLNETPSVSRHAGRSAPLVASPSLPLAKSEESASEPDPLPVPSTPTDVRDDKAPLSAPHLFHTDDASTLDGNKEYGRSEEDTEIRSSNSVDREHRRHEIGEPEPSDPHATRSSKKSKRSLYATAASAASQPTNPNSDTKSDNSTQTPPVAASSSSAPVNSPANAALSSSPIITAPNGASTGTGAPTGTNAAGTSNGLSSGSKATSSKGSNTEVATPAASTSTSDSKALEGQLQVKKGGFFRLTKKWEPRWCTFEGRVFQAYKNKDDKVPVMHIDITKAIVTGSNDRNLKVLELIAQGKRSHWTGPNISTWIKAMRSMSIISLNAKRRTADYGDMRDFEPPVIPASGGDAASRIAGRNAVDFDSSGEVYQSLDVATEEEDRPFGDEITSASPSDHNHSSDGRRGARGKRKPRKTVTDEHGNPSTSFRVDSAIPSSSQAASSTPQGAVNPSEAVITTSPTPTSSKSKSKSATNFHVHAASTDSTSFATSLSSATIAAATAKEGGNGESGAANGNSSPGHSGAPGAPSPTSSPTLNTESASQLSGEGGIGASTAQRSPSRSKRSSITLPPSSAAEEPPKPSNTPLPSNSRQQGRAHHRHGENRPLVPKKTSSVGNFKTSKLSDELFHPGSPYYHGGGGGGSGAGGHHTKAAFSRQSRVLFDDAPCKEAIARYASQLKSKRHSPRNGHATPVSPRSGNSGPSSSYSLQDEESEFEDPYYDDDNLVVPSEAVKDAVEGAGSANFPVHFKRPLLQAAFQVVAPRPTSDHKPHWLQRYCTFDGLVLREYANASDAKNGASLCGSFDILHSKVTPIYISRVMCLEIYEEESGKREFWRGIEVSNWLPHLERFAGRGYDPILGGLLVRQCHHDESQWIARYCTFNGHQFQSFRNQGDLVPIWSSHIRHLSARSIKQGGGVELMELMLDGGAQSLWWSPPKPLISHLVRPLPALKHVNFTTGSVATTSGGDTPTLASVLRATAPLEVPENRSVRDSVNGREDDEDEWRTLKERVSDWISIIREAHEICIGDSERYIADEWDLESDDEDPTTNVTRKAAKGSFSGVSAHEMQSLKGVLSYKVAKKNWEPRYVELAGRYLHLYKKKHDKKAEHSIKVTKCKTALKRSNDAKHPETLEITLDDHTHVFRGKSLLQWHEALLSVSGNIHTSTTHGLATTHGINNGLLNLNAVDPNELSAAESRSESVLTSSRRGAREESEEGFQDDGSRSEDLRRDPEEQPRTASVPLSLLAGRRDTTAKSTAGSTPGANSDTKLGGSDLASTAASVPPIAVLATGSNLHSIPSVAQEGTQSSAETTRPKFAMTTTTFSLGLSNSLLNHSATDMTTDDSSSGPLPSPTPVPAKGSKFFRTPIAAIDSVKSIGFDELMHHPTSYYSDADDNQFAPTVENLPKPAWTGPIARYRTKHQNWVGRYIVVRPTIDILVYLSKPASIEAVPPLATIPLANVTSATLNSIEGYQVIEIHESVTLTPTSQGNTAGITTAGGGNSGISATQINSSAPGSSSANSGLLASPNQWKDVKEASPILGTSSSSLMPPKEKEKENGSVGPVAASASAIAGSVAHKQHLWHTADAFVLAELIESSSLATRANVNASSLASVSKPRKRSSKRQMPPSNSTHAATGSGTSPTAEREKNVGTAQTALPAASRDSTTHSPQHSNPAASATTVYSSATHHAKRQNHKLSNMSGSSPALDIPGRTSSPADRERDKEKEPKEHKEPKEAKEPKEHKERDRTKTPSKPSPPPPEAKS